MSLYVDGALQTTLAAPTPGRRRATWSSAAASMPAGRSTGSAARSTTCASIRAALSAGDVGATGRRRRLALRRGLGHDGGRRLAQPQRPHAEPGRELDARRRRQLGARVDGTSGAAEASGPVIDTTQGFSVAAWVRADSATGFRTAVSVDGSQISGFFLQRRGDGTFAFARIATDAPGAAAAAASTTTARGGPVVPPGRRLRQRGEHAHAVRRRVKQQTVAAPAAWKATGHFVVGRGRYAGAPTDFWRARSTTSASSQTRSTTPPRPRWPSLGLLALRRGRRQHGGRRRPGG